MSLSTDPGDVTGNRAYQACARCGYSLRGLPPNHACPECGLRFDERCALYRVTNSKKVLALWLLLFGWATFMSVTNFRHLANLSSASTFDIFNAIIAVVVLPCGVVAITSMVRRYRQGFRVAITSDGLFLRLPHLVDELVPWRHVGPVSVLPGKDGKPRIASVFLEHKSKTIHIGGMANVFPTRADVERFVQQAGERAEAAHKEPTT